MSKRLSLSMAVAVVVPEGTYGYIDGTRAAQDMMLAAWGEGIGSNWVGSGDTPEVKELLGIPNDRKVLVLIPFGYPAGSVGAGRKNRKALSEVAHAERFGQPFSG